MKKTIKVELTLEVETVCSDKNIREAIEENLNFFSRKKFAIASVYENEEDQPDVTVESWRFVE